MPQKYTDKDIEFIRANRFTLTLKEIADKLGYSLSGIGRACKQHNIIISKEAAKYLRVKSMIGRTTSTPEIDAILKDKYLEMPIKVLARHINKSHCFVAKRLEQLGLHIPEEIVKQRIEASRKKPGDVPFNKGRKQVEYMSPEAIAKTALTRYGKGNLPHNTKHDGAITIRRCREIPYKWVRLGIARWDLLHRVVWRQHNGPIPKGYNVTFKDGNSLNCNIENLYLISLEDNMMNNTIQRYPEELKQTIRLHRKLERLINKKTTCHKTN